MCVWCVCVCECVRACTCACVFCVFELLVHLCAVYRKLKKFFPALFCMLAHGRDY